MATDSFAQHCRSIAALVEKKEVLDEKMLSYLSHDSAEQLKNDADSLPQEFFDLHRDLSDYWQQHAQGDENKARVFSYIRAFQICNMLKTAMTEKKHA